jgi:hypothetical protein
VPLLGPGGDYAGHAGVGDELAHVLVGVDDDAQIHSVHGGIAILDVDFALEIFRRDGQMGLLHGVLRALEPVDDLGFCGDGLFLLQRQFGRHFGAGHAQQVKIRDGDVHVDFAGGAHAGRGTPGEFFLGGGFGEREQLAGDVAPLAVIALLDSFGGHLREHGARSKE